MDKTFYLETFGCQMNVVDSERIVDLLGGIGYRQVEQAQQAHLLLLNTCAVRDKAVRKAYGHLGRFKPLKDADSSLIIGLGGCVAQQEGEELLKEFPYLDLVFGTHNVHRLPELVNAVEVRRGKAAAVDFLDRETRLQLFPSRIGSEAVTRFVTVMQGCDNFCSFCVVPIVRGREISRPGGEILAEIRDLAAQGVREITLIGQNVNSYGVGVAGEMNFAGLLRAVAAIDGIARIRFTTSHPKDLSDELIACFGEIDKLSSHLHLPVQSGSDRILREMNRGYGRDHYLGLVDKLKQACPEIRLTTDVIVGFPGEDAADFEATMTLLAEVRYAEIYSFLFSPRRGTAAAELPDATPAAVKQERFDRMLALQNAISEQTWQADVGQVREVLVEGESKQGRGQLFGRTTWNRIVNFSGSPELVGQLVPVRITKSYRNSQLGELVKE
ncbi:MAG: tRNA (N6-isopentenyl adenosine(37)-C2)-methylthiotransferase MiaB [Deltaproteobacteria bacterium]|nr:MAG: tRNA (N6-isopentenyl adenosine(37)-C2)-methylthiotransferase MiaB [Deltaproteobacteria bacterium]